MQNYNQGYGSHNLCLEVEFDLPSDSRRHTAKRTLNWTTQVVWRPLGIWGLSRENSDNFFAAKKKK